MVADKPTAGAPSSPPVAMPTQPPASVAIDLGENGAGQQGRVAAHAWRASQRRLLVWELTGFFVLVTLLCLLAVRYRDIARSHPLVNMDYARPPTDALYAEYAAKDADAGAERRPLGGGDGTPDKEWLAFWAALDDEESALASEDSLPTENENDGPSALDDANAVVEDAEVRDGDLEEDADWYPSADARLSGMRGNHDGNKGPADIDNAPFSGDPDEVEVDAWVLGGKEAPASRRAVVAVALGLGTGADRNAIVRNFALSLRQANSDTDLLVFAELSPAERTNATRRRQAGDYSEPESPGSFLDALAEEANFAVTYIAREDLPEPWRSMPPQLHRYFLFESFVESIRGRYGAVAVVDLTGGVIFQKDPFALVSIDELRGQTGIHVFQAPVALGATTAGSWLRLCLGKEKEGVGAALNDWMLIGDVILGDIDSMAKYLAAVRDVILAEAKGESGTPTGADDDDTNDLISLGNERRDECTMFRASVATRAHDAIHNFVARQASNFGVLASADGLFAVSFSTEITRHRKVVGASGDVNCVDDDNLDVLSEAGFNGDAPVDAAPKVADTDMEVPYPLTDDDGRSYYVVLGYRRSCVLSRRIDAEFAPLVMGNYKG